MLFRAPSRSTLTVVEPDAAASKGAMQVTGEVVTGPSTQFAFACALFFPGAAPMQPTDLSNKKQISFWAKGDGKTYTLIVPTDQRNGQGSMPAMTTFVASPEWKHDDFPFLNF
jgi:hypothetical protein